MKKVRFRCPWCREDVEVARRESKGAKKKSSAKKSGVQVVLAKCPECEKPVQLSHRG
ncbi:MAG TPA: hypothetical protein VM597_24645 [Gemmataceae bacterium]|jgi:endogenous inhibitor of DNA gyrase (YacG/DUF329 family)|nr:hypothetical protein [Gemmataceae bacterium]